MKASERIEEMKNKHKKEKPIKFTFFLQISPG